MHMKKEFNWGEFLNEDKCVAVHCATKAEAKDFCQQMHKHGLRWKDGSQYIDDDNWELFKQYMCYDNHGTCFASCWSNSKMLEQFTFYDWSDFYRPEEFTMDSLKTGMIVKLRHGGLYTVFKNTVDYVAYYAGGYLINGKSDGCFELRNYQDFKFQGASSCDIVAVYQPATPKSIIDPEYRFDYAKLLWEEPQSRRCLGDLKNGEIFYLNNKEYTVIGSLDNLVFYILSDKTGTVGCTNSDTVVIAKEEK